MVEQIVRSEGTIGRILAAAQALFLDRPFANVTMDDIAEGASATKGALYHHFKGKEELYAAMMAADLEEKRALFNRAVDSVEGARNRLRALTAAYFALPLEKRDLIHLMRRNSDCFGGVRRASLVRAYQQALPEPVERVLRDAIRDGEIRRGDPRLLSWHFISIVEITLNRYADSLFKDDEARLDHVIDLFFRGVNP